MKSCERCGIKFQHNYLVAVLAVIKEKRERMIVCLKCRDSIKSKEKDG